MTRLTSKDIQDTGGRLDEFEAELKAKTGRSLLGLACHAVGAEERRIGERLAVLRTAVVPMTCGRGCIPGFSEALRAIANHLGSRASVTGRPDVGGLGEAFKTKCDILLLADDDSYLALEVNKKIVVDNDQATAQGFVAGLGLMAGGVAGKSCLVIGCGPVGLYAAEALASQEARVALFDLEPDKIRQGRQRLARSSPGTITGVRDLSTGLNENSLIIEATNSAGVIPESVIRPDTFIAAPGMPLGVEPAGVARAGSRILHDSLRIGTATMLVKIVHEQERTG